MKSKDLASSLNEHLRHKTKARSVVRNITSDCLTSLIEIAQLELDKREGVKLKKEADEALYTSAARNLMQGSADPAMKQIFESLCTLRHK